MRKCVPEIRERWPCNEKDRSREIKFEEDLVIKVETSDQNKTAGVCEYFLFEVLSQRDAFQIKVNLGRGNKEETMGIVWE